MGALSSIFNRKVKGLTFLLLFMVLSTITTTYWSPSPYVSFSLFALYLLVVFFTEKRFFLSYGYIIFYIITNVVGVFLIETGQFHLSELNIVTSNHHSLHLLTMAHLVFIETMRILYNRNDHDLELNSAAKVRVFRFEFPKMLLLQLGLIAIFFVFLVMFLMVIDKPFFKVKLDRFLYKEEYMNWFTDKVSNMSLYFSVFIGMYFFHKKDKKVIPLILLLFVYLFWIGHKFSLFLVIAFVIALPFIYFVSYKKLNKIITGTIALLVLLIAVVSVQSAIVYKRDFAENNKYFSARLAQQGQLWWATYGKEEAHQTHLDELTDETKTYFNLGTSEEILYQSGIYKIMRLTTPEDIFNRKIYEKRSRYAYSTQASVFYYFNATGLLLFSIAAGAVYYAINQRLMRSIIRLELIPALLFTRLFVIMNRMLMQSDFNKLFSLEVIVIILILVGYYQVQKRDLKSIKI